ncbi:MAG TPA: peptidylprolyl isomerase [Pseudomonadales bacterium]|nr:peptidylprolyl isomerase [Pseudomonadales bacterium]
MQIAHNSVVSMHYTLKDDQGNILDSSVNAAPLVYLHGASNIIPGLENALVGKQSGDTLDVRVAPEEGYGIKIDDLIQEVPREMFQGVDTIEPGMTFQAQDQSGYIQQVTVTAVTDAIITVDSNHPLAGQHLNFNVSIIDVRQATEEEMAHGHVHGEGGHHH